MDKYFTNKSSHFSSQTISALIKNIRRKKIQIRIISNTILIFFYDIKLIINIFPQNILISKTLYEYIKEESFHSLNKLLKKMKLKIKTRLH